MKEIAIVGIGSFGVARFMHTVAKNLSNNEIIIIDIKTLTKHGKTNNIPIPYRPQLLAYKELEVLLEDIPKMNPKMNPNKKPFREGSKFVPLKKRR